MKRIYDITIAGRNLISDKVETKDILQLLSMLVSRLESKGYSWRDVSLLLIFNSKKTDFQLESDQSLISALAQHCSSHSWFPSLIGTTVFSAFYSDSEEYSTELNDGILVAAMVNSVVDRIPVTNSVSEDVKPRNDVGSEAIRLGVNSLKDKIQQQYETHLNDIDISNSTTGLLFTTGVGYIENREFIDFRQAYSVGENIKLNWSHMAIVGGSSSNRAPKQLQCLYYSMAAQDHIDFRFTYKHSAVFAIMPYSPSALYAGHPYEIAEKNFLEIEFSNHEKYSDGRYFYVQSINDRDPVEFFSSLWGVSVEELDKMEEEHKALAADPRTFEYTIGSAKSSYETSPWPNIPSRTKRLNGKRTIRILRAEPRDSNLYLLKLGQNGFRKNCDELLSTFQNRIGKDSLILSFFCESRKYLSHFRSLNFKETDHLLSQLPSLSSFIGTYLNGEYSLGLPHSLGYHNFSLIASILPRRNVNELPFSILNNIQKNKSLTIFWSHSSRDKSIVREIRDQIDIKIAPYIDNWIDEDKMVTGEHLSDSIREAIENTSDYFVIFISKYSVNSDWVQKEVLWGVKKEREMGRTFILPILLDDVMEELKNQWGEIDNDYFEQKIYLKVPNMSANAIKYVANKLSNDLKELIRRNNFSEAQQMH